MNYVETPFGHIDLRPAFDDIETLWKKYRLNRNEQGLIAIGVFIAYGLNRRRPICGAMKRLGFRPSHAAVLLTKSTGNDPERHHWQCNNEGVYNLFEAAAAA